MNDVPSSALRIWAKVIDNLIVAVFLFPAFGWLAFSLFGSESLWISWPFVIYLVLVPLLYEALSLWIFGTSFGKWVFFLKVVQSRDSRRSLTLGQAMVRALAGRLSLFFSHAVQALALFKYNRTHLADWLSGSRVVTTRPRPKQARLHWIVGSIAVAVFAWSGLMFAILMLQHLDFTSAGLYYSPVELGSGLDFGF